nr:uncharacterized protein LOC113828819 [Penaeus vannamei]
MEAKIVSDGLEQFPESQALQVNSSENMSEPTSNHSTETMTGYFSVEGNRFSFRYQQPLDAPNTSASLSSACDSPCPSNNAHHPSIVKRGKGRPRKNTSNNHKVLNTSKAIRKRGRPRKHIVLEKKIGKEGGQMPCDSVSANRKRKLDENANTPDRKRIKLSESSEFDCHIDPESQEADIGIFIDTVGSLETKETCESTDLSMPYIDFKCVGENYVSEDQKMRIHSQKDGSALDQDFIPISTEDDTPSNNNCNLNGGQEILSINSVHPEDIVYDVLPWFQIDDLKPGIVIPASKGGGIMYDLLYQFKIDAGRFLEEATGLNIHVFTECCPTPTNKIPMALFMQMSNGHLLRIKCQQSKLNLSLPIPVDRQNISSDPIYCSTPRPHVHSIDARQTKSGKKRWPTSDIQDQRILESQKDWFAFLQRMCYIYPEITDKKWQPYVKLTRLITSDGHHSDFKDEDFTEDSGADGNNKNPQKKARFDNVQLDKTPRNPGCQTHTSNNGRTYSCTEGCPQHVLIHRELSPPLSSCCYNPEVRIFHIVRVLETLCMSDIMVIISVYMQRWEAERCASKKLHDFHTEDVIPLSSTESKVESTHTLKEGEM